MIAAGRILFAACATALVVALTFLTIKSAGSILQ